MANNVNAKMFNLSSLAFKGKSLSKIRSHSELDWIPSIEMSAGPYENNLMIDLECLIKDQKIIHLHNYYPVPKDPFVINLCSMNDQIYTKSIQNLKKSILISAKMKAKVFSFHAGFFIDPDPQTLGGLLEGIIIPREIGLMRFRAAVSELKLYADNLKIKLLIENNVLIQEVLSKFDSQILMFTHIHNTQELKNLLPDGVGFLIDTGHLKVSSKTLGFDKYKFLSDVENQIGGLHLSDNDGYQDSNLIFNEKSWIYNLKKVKCDYVTLEVKEENFSDIKKCFEKVRETFGA